MGRAGAFRTNRSRHPFDWKVPTARCLNKGRHGRVKLGLAPRRHRASDAGVTPQWALRTSFDLKIVCAETPLSVYAGVTRRLNHRTINSAAVLYLCVYDASLSC